MSLKRISGVDLPSTKSLFIGLSYVHGIGRKQAQKICEATNVDCDIKVGSVTDVDFDKIRAYIRENYKIEGDLKAEVKDNIKRLVSMGCYKGLRHRKGLPVRGQRTKNNSRTRRKRSN
jgi:small subunit ribosomal protein S13